MLQLDSILYKFFGPSKFSVIMSLKPYFQLIIRDHLMRPAKANLSPMLILWFKRPLCRLVLMSVFRPRVLVILSKGRILSFCNCSLWTFGNTHPKRPKQVSIVFQNGFP